MTDQTDLVVIKIIIKNEYPDRSELFTRLRSAMLECPFPFDKNFVSSAAL